MRNNDLPRSDWLKLALMSKDEEDYTDEWGAILDEENFERLDREVMLSGTDSDRPDKAPYNGAKYYATDSNVVYVWKEDMSKWNVMNTGAAARPVPGTTHLASASIGQGRTTHDISGAQLDLRRYGADISGSEPVDDALSEAIAEANEGDTILFRNGTFRLDERHRIDKPLTLKGINAELITNRVSSDDEPRVIFAGDGLTGDRTVLSDEVERGQQSLPVTDASVLEPGDSIVIHDDLELPGDTATIIDFLTVDSVDTVNNTITIHESTTYDYPPEISVERVDLLNNPKIVGMVTDGEQLDGDGDFFKFEWCSNAVYDDVTITGSTVHSLSSFLSDNTSITNCAVKEVQSKEPNEGYGVRAYASPNMLIQGITATNVRRGVDLAGSSHSCTVLHPVVHNFSVAGIGHHGAYCHDTTISGGTIRAGTNQSEACIQVSHGNVSINGTSMIVEDRGIQVNPREDGKLDLGVRLTATDVDFEALQDGSRPTAVRVDGNRSSPEAVKVQGTANGRYFWTITEVRPIADDIGVVEFDIDVREWHDDTEKLAAHHIRGSEEHQTAVVRLSGYIEGTSDGTIVRHRENAKNTVGRLILDGLVTETPNANRGLNITFDSDPGEVIVQNSSILSENWTIFIRSDADIVRLKNNTLKSTGENREEIRIDQGKKENVWIVDNQYDEELINEDSIKNLEKRGNLP